MTWKWMNLGKRKQPNAVRLLCPVRSVLIPFRERMGRTNKPGAKLNFIAAMEELPSYLKIIPREQAKLVMDAMKKRRPPEPKKISNLNSILANPTYSKIIDKMVNHSVFADLSLKSNRQRNFWIEFGKPAFTLENLKIMKRFIDHLNTQSLSFESSVQWIDHEFCPNIWRNYNSLTSLSENEKSEMFKTLAYFCSSARKCGYEFMKNETDRDIIRFISSEYNSIVDKHPYFYFDYIEYVLFADGLDSNIEDVRRISAEYFHQNKDLHSVFQLHNLSPTRRIALQKFYDEEASYLDIIEPVMQPTINRNSKSYNHGLNEGDLAQFYTEQAEIESNTYLRVKNLIPKNFQQTKNQISSFGEVPDIATCEKLMKKYKMAWANSLEIALVELDVAIDDEIANGCEGIVEMMNLLRLRMELNLFLINELNYGDTWRELSHGLIQFRVESPADQLHSDGTDNPFTHQLNMTKEMAIFLMTFLQKKQKFEPNIFSQLNPTSAHDCGAFSSMSEIIISHMQTFMLCHANFPDAIEWLNSPETSLTTTDDDFYESNQSNISKINPRKSDDETIFYILQRQIDNEFLYVRSYELPMIHPPRPYKIVNNTVQGGFLLRDVDIIKQRNELNLKSNSINLTKTTFYREYPKEKMQPMIDAVNNYNSMPFKINQKVFEVIKQMYCSREGSVVCQLPSHQFRSEDGELRPSTNFGTLDYKKLKKEEFGLSELIDKVISIADWLGERTFWLVQAADFRGRLYPIGPFINHLSNDETRAMFKFKNGSKLGGKQIDGRTGLDWLLIHLVNVSEVKKKVSTKESLETGRKLIPIVLECAQNPLDGSRWWMTAENPFETLAVCFEISDAIKSGDPENFISHLPVYQDGTCNGYQHWSAIGRDIVGAEASNVIQSKSVPSDLYTEILRNVEKEYEKDLESHDEQVREMAKVAKRITNRKVVKRPVMTIPYGVTNTGATSHVKEEIAHRVETHLVNPLSQYIAGKVFLSVDTVFQSSMKLKKWLTNLTNQQAAVGNNMAWISPLGMPVSQFSYEQKPKNYDKYDYWEMNLTLSKNEIIDNFIGYNPQASVGRSKNGIAPNFVHTLDASHAQLTSIYMTNEDLPFQSVHDSYWTTASNVARMNYLLRKAFVEMYQHEYPEQMVDLMEFYFDMNRPFGCKIDMTDPASHIKKIINSMERRQTLYMDIPARGKMNIDDVMDAEFFFS